MIEQYTLKMLCEKYKLNAEKIVNKNNNILKLGEYQNIDETLNYLINELLIAPSSIEKCPSILYRNVANIKYNVSFLKRQNIVFDNIESCLHVLSSEPNDLIDTYNYVKNNYNENIINKISSILSVPKKIIVDVENLNIPFYDKTANLSVAIGVNWNNAKFEEIQKLIQSKEFKEHPELFTSTTLTHAKFEEIQKIIQSKEFKEHPELFTSETLAHAKFEEIQKIIQSKEFNEYPELFTSETLAYAKFEEIQKIIQSKEFKSHPELFTSSTLAHTKLEEIQRITQSKEFNNHPELFTSTTLAYAKLDDIQKIIQSEEFKSHPELFTSETLAYAKLEEIQRIIQSEEFKSHPELFTSTTLALAKLEEIQRIIRSEEFNNHPELFTSTTLALAKFEEIQKIIQSKEFKSHPELFTSQTLAHAKLRDIQQLLKMECWKEDRFKKLLTSSIVAKSKSMISKLSITIQIAEYYNIDRFLTTSFLLTSPSQNYALIQYLNELNISLVIDEKLNSIFGKQPGVLKKKYNIDINDLIRKYPLNLEENLIMNGEKRK